MVARESVSKEYCDRAGLSCFSLCASFEVFFACPVGSIPRMTVFCQALQSAIRVIPDKPNNDDRNLILAVAVQFLFELGDPAF